METGNGKNSRYTLNGNSDFYFLYAYVKLPLISCTGICNGKNNKKRKV